MTSPPFPIDDLSRRDALKRAGLGFGSLALASLLQATVQSADKRPVVGEVSPLAAKKPHFAPRAKHVIHLFMNGGPSQVDTFDPKPALEKLHGKPLLTGASASDKRLGGAAFASPFKFQKHGECGMEVSELFPHVARHVDDLCLIRSMVTDVPNHEPGLMMMNCGNVAQSRPSVGAWVLYGLGTENQSLPGFLVMCPNGLPTAQSGNWRNSFLPGIFQGTRIDTKETRPEQLISNLRNDFLVGKQQRQQLELVQELNAVHQAQRNRDPKLEARIQSLELAFRMQTEATDAFDVDQEPAHVLEMYGDTLQGRQMLMARRLVERGVRFVQVYHGAGQPWDSHNNLVAAHKRLAQESDQAVAALLADLKQQGLLDDTLVVWGGEIGRTPTIQLPITKTPGRDHHHKGFTMWMAGGGVKKGFTFGSTNELGLEVAEDPVHVHDLHATILHLLGLDHERLTYHYAGRDFSLTDIHGRVVTELIA